MLRSLRLPLVSLALFAPLAGAAQLAAPAVDGASDSATQTRADESDAELAEDHLRILTLRSGQTLRTRSKFDGDQWLVRMNGGWSGLPSGLVVESATVKALLKEAKRLERSLKLSDPDQRAELAFWLAEHGLYNEALSHLDINLRKDPDHGPTLAIIERGLVPVRLDKYVPKTAPAARADAASWAKATRDLFDGLARLSPATREIAWQKVRPVFATDERLPAFIAATTTILHDHSSARRKLAASALQRLAIEQLKGTDATAQTAVKSLINRAALDGTEDVRTASARTLRDLNEPAVTAPLVKALGSRSSAVRSNSADALGVIGVASVAPALVAALAATNAAGSSYSPPASSLFVGRQIAYIQDFDVEAFSGAVAADPQVNVITEGAVLDVRVISVSQRLARVNERSSLRGALGALLGQDFRYNTKAWSDWIGSHPATE